MKFHRLPFSSWLLSSLLAASVHAAPTDIASRPLITADPDAVKANLLFVMDDSGSMDFDFLPDHVGSANMCRNKGATPRDGATAASSGGFGSGCCQASDPKDKYGNFVLNGTVGADGNVCWTGAAPFGTRRAHPPFLAAGFNGVAYDPSITYTPPVKSDGSSWPSQTTFTSVKNDAYGVQNTSTINLLTQFPDTEWCTDDSYDTCLRNGNYVLPGTVEGKNYVRFRATTATGKGKIAVGSPEAATVQHDVSFGPHYYEIEPGEYCNSLDMRSCQATATTEFKYPVKVRWCNSDANSRLDNPAFGVCQAIRNGTYAYARYPTKFMTGGTAAVVAVPAVPETPAKAATTSFSISSIQTNSGSACNLSVTAVTVNSINLLNAPTGNYSSKTALRDAIIASINAKPSTNYTAALDGSSIKLTAPMGSNTYKVTFSKTPSSCNLNVSPTTPQFAGYVAYKPGIPGVAGEAAKPSAYAGTFQRVDIVSTAAPFTRPATRQDCAAIKGKGTPGSCTYDEEMTNFANWWTYYHSRMQTMKTAASQAFVAVGNNRRLGYLSINNSTKKDFLNLDVFEDTETTKQRQLWFTKLTSALPSGSTPLKAALGTAGKLFAGKLNDKSLNGTSKVVDPVEYSCQKNAVILSTDGYWNEDTVAKRLDGSDLDDVDSDADKVKRPQYDGTATKNTLADVAYYNANTDMRTTDLGNCTSGSTTKADVCGNDDVVNQQQSVLTFTLGLGVSGYMQFAENYLSGGSNDYNAVVSGKAANPGAGDCTWQKSGVCNWPVPSKNTLTAVDDLWHAAVNGGGTYFSATNPTELNKGLKKALAEFDGVLGASSAAATSNPNVSSGDNFAFISTFRTSDWTGDLNSSTIDLKSGVLDEDSGWSARTKLDAKAASRTVYMFDGAGKAPKPFMWDEMTAAEKAYFALPWITATGGSGNKGEKLSQFCAGPEYCLSADDQTAAAGERLVDFLRGFRTDEGDLLVPKKFFRERKHVLGDIVSSEAVYVNKALVDYADEGYRTFNVAKKTPMVYVGANDGMLHAFEASTGEEVWAYVPSAVLPKLYRLADKQYATSHQYFVDASPLVQDIKAADGWKTILVGGLGAGGRAYYALDITDAASPKVMWEFTHDNLGLTFGQAEVGKLKNGKWVVVVPSGYNNINPGDGKGRLFVLDAETGLPLTEINEGKGIETTAGSETTPAGLAHIRAWVDKAALDNTLMRVYGGDNLGNLWRFDINDLLAPTGHDAHLLATLRGKTGSIQPITSRPDLGLARTSAMVYVGTGRYLGDADLSDTVDQSVYGIRDPLDTTTWNDPRSIAGKFTIQELQSTDGDGKALKCDTKATWCNSGDVVRTSTAKSSVVLESSGGWFADLPQTKERVNTDPMLVLGTLVVISNVIDTGNLCKAGGSSWVNYFDYITGKASSVSLGDVISSRPTVYRLPNNQLHGLSRNSKGGNSYLKPPVGEPVGATRRISWRDLQQQ